MSGNIVHCGTKRCRVGPGHSIPLENAARNILVAGEYTETKKGHRGQQNTTAKVAAACNMSTRRGTTAY
ncbi:MAG: hypothetical protein O4859_27220 [Trichodesmium sp. St18_bin1]|nr:hypothetical protein [Trichodesmium sp. St18_bin1]